LQRQLENKPPLRQVSAHIGKGVSHNLPVNAILQKHRQFNLSKTPKLRHSNPQEGAVVIGLISQQTPVKPFIQLQRQFTLSKTPPFKHESIPQVGKVGITVVTGLISQHIPVNPFMQLQRQLTLSKIPPLKHEAIPHVG